MRCLGVQDIPVFSVDLYTSKTSYLTRANGYLQGKSHPCVQVRRHVISAAENMSTFDRNLYNDLKKDKLVSVFLLLLLLVRSIEPCLDTQPKYYEDCGELRLSMLCFFKRICENGSA